MTGITKEKKKKKSANHSNISAIIFAVFNSGRYWTIPGTVKKAHKGKTKTNSRTGNSITFGIPMWWWLACLQSCCEFDCRFIK